MNNQQELKGLGGWLIVMGIGVILSPIVLLYEGFSLLEFFKQDGVSQLNNPASDIYYPALLWFILGECVVNLVLLLLSLYAAYLFFSKHYRFPKFYIGLMIGYLLVLFADCVISELLIPQESAFDSETITELAKSALRCVIWVPYLLISVRVKNTFVEHRKMNQNAK